MADEKRWAAECFRRGNDAMNKANWELAVEMFSNCVKFDPQNLTYRQLLRNSTKKKYKDNGTGAGTFGKTKLMSIRSRIKKAKAAEDWEEMSKAAEEGLLVNPWDTQLNIELAEASKKLERGEIARFAYFEACRSAPKDIAVHELLAELLRERREYDEAIKVWERISQLDPSSMKPMRMITQLQTEKTTDRGGYESAANTRDVMTNKNALKGSASTVAPGESVETDLRHAIRKEPDKVENYLKLAAVLKTQKRFQDAYDIALKGAEISGNDPAVIEQVEDLELLVMKFKLDEAKEKANESGDEALRKEAAQMSIALRDRRIDILSRRTERYPANLNIKLELAQLLMQLQKWAQAIPLLQKAGQDPRLRAQALVALGECFVYDKKLSLARGQFERAVPDLNIDQNPEIYKKCHYLLGRVCEELGDGPTAEKHYGEVLVVDYEYKDARQRLEKLQGGT